MVPAGLGGYNGLGEAQVLEMVDRKVAEQRRSDQMESMGKELEALRSKNTSLKEANEELEEKIKAKNDLEFYSGIIGAAFPGLAPLFNGTPLAQAAGFLAGTNGLNGVELSAASDDASNGSSESTADSSQAGEEEESIAAMVGEFCNTLNNQEASANHLLFMAFEADRNKIQKALHYITATAPA